MAPPSPPTSALHLALATDRAYLPYAAVALMSLCEHSDRATVTHILHEGTLDLDDEIALGQLIGPDHSVLLHRLDSDWLGQFPSKGPGAGDRISWARLALPHLLPSVKRLVYLDADTFVCRPVRPLFELDLEANVLAAVPNVVQPEMHAHIRKVGIDDPRHYFNAGVLLLSLERMRTEGVIDEVCALVARTGTELTWFDQDALNVVLKTRWKPLHPRWNVQNSFWVWEAWAGDVFSDEELQQAKADPAILHFEGPEPYKPWHVLNQHPFRHTYRGALARTPWSREATTGRTRLEQVIARLPAAWQLPTYNGIASAKYRMRLLGNRSLRRLRANREG